MALAPPGGAAGAIGTDAPRSRSAEVTSFAKAVVDAAAPSSRARAKALLYAAGRLGTFAVSVGLELDPEVVLASATIERFIVTEGARASPATRRTLRSNLRALARTGLSGGPPAPVPLARERAKVPYGDAEIAAYVALANAQPTPARRMRFLGLIALGAGAGLMGADLRTVRGDDVVARSGGVVVCVSGRRARTVPVLARHHEGALAAAAFAGAGYVTGGFSARRRNVTSGLVASVAGGVDLATIETSRLRATWLVAVAEAIGLRTFMVAAGITCSQRLGDLVATLESSSEAEAVSLLGALR